MNSWEKRNSRGSPQSGHFMNELVCSLNESLERGEEEGRRGRGAGGRRMDEGGGGQSICGTMGRGEGEGEVARVPGSLSHIQEFPEQSVVLGLFLGLCKETPANMECSDELLHLSLPLF